MTRPARRRRPTDDGFTLVELVVVVMLLGILAGVAAPKLLGVGAHASHQALVTEVDAIFKAVELYAAYEGSLPADVPRRRTPAGLEAYLDPAILAGSPPVGGAYDWQGPTSNHEMIGLRIHNADAASSAEVDRLVDDGAGDTGWVRHGSGSLDFLLEQ